jgi:hypothetical protein
MQTLGSKLLTALHMHQQVMAILVQPCLGFFFSFDFFCGGGWGAKEFAWKN